MLQEIMEYTRNYFVPLRAELVQYTIAGGRISPSFGAEDGDRFLICGSRRNNGVYTWHRDYIANDDDTDAVGLRDETFAGTIRVCDVPPALLTLSGEIKKWVETFGKELTSPIAGESFNGYSYTLKTGGGAGGSGPLTWMDQFGKQLEIYRRPYI